MVPQIWLERRAKRRVGPRIVVLDPLERAAPLARLPTAAGGGGAQQQQEFVAELAGLDVQTASKAAVITAAEPLRPLSKPVL